jgi:peptidoglycan/xylan/chitin deacetylase (PgdA/CDA1 family)
MIDSSEMLRKLALNFVRLSGLSALARPWTAGVGAILMLHRVTDAPGKSLGLNRHLSITPAFLDALIAEMRVDGYVFVSMDEAVERLRAGGSGPRFAALTADDAYRDNLVEALPVLEKHQAPLTIYVAPALIDGAIDMWWDVVEDIVMARDRLDLQTPAGRLVLDCSTPAGKRAANARLHDYLACEVSEAELGRTLRDLARAAGVDHDAPRRDTLMGWDDLRRIAANPLVTIGAHTVSHLNLRRLPDEVALREVAEAASILGDRLGHAPRHMAYPYGYAGAVGMREVGLAGEAGYVSAVTTRHGVLHRAHASHLHALPRISVNGRYQRLGHLRAMLSGATTPLANRGRLVVTV